MTFTLPFLPFLIDHNSPSPSIPPPYIYYNLPRHLRTHALHHIRHARRTSVPARCRARLPHRRRRRDGTRRRRARHRARRVGNAHEVDAALHGGAGLRWVDGCSVCVAGLGGGGDGARGGDVARGGVSQVL